MSIGNVKVKDIVTNSGFLTVRFADGQILSNPLAWYPSLNIASAKELSHWEADSEGIRWPDLDYDLSIEGLFEGAKEMPGLIEYTRWIRTLSRSRRRTATYGDWLAARGKHRRATQPAAS